MKLMKTASIAIAMILLGTSLASAGGFHLPDLGGSDSDSDSSGDIFHDAMPDNDPPDFGSIFNPQPQIDLNPDVIDTLNEDPRIPVVIDLGLGQDGAKPTKGKLNAKVTFGAVLNCVVSGTPSEFPDDLRIANAGVVALPAGTDIKWKAAGIGGVASLGKALQPGRSIKLSNVLPGGAEAGTVCSAKAIGL